MLSQKKSAAVLLKTDEHPAWDMWKPAITNSPLFENLRNNGDAPFDALEIDDSSFLDDKECRENCSNCGRSRMWFCYDCRLPLPSLVGRFPQVTLPFSVDIIKHGRELDGKSTGVQASILSAQVRLFTYPEIADYDPNTVLLIFPAKKQFDEVCRESVSLGGDLRECPLCQGKHVPFAFDRIILIDSTWAQTKRIILDERIAALPNRAGLKGRESVFWRPQRGRNLDHLATVEALHEVCRQWLRAQGCPSAASVDNILFFFRHFYQKITRRYKTLLDSTGSQGQPG